ncbi:cysteine proteinase [Rhizophagus irregularis DAOM 181602=DAOM 197198]|nr:cysteine proteinase [Rhizophagus irregularis DAOM 181602=DAOM 197198]
MPKLGQEIEDFKYSNKLAPFGNEKDYLGTEPVERIQEEHATLYAEEIPQDEIHVDQNNRASYSSISFHKGSDGILFKFVIKNSETLANTKVCLRHRLGMSEKDFSKVKIAIVSETSYANPEYLDDDEMTLSNEGCLGLDHVDKSGCAESVFIRG